MILGYHELAESRTGDVYAVSSRTFRRHAEIVQERCSNRSCITFDDGHISQFSIAGPILDELSISAIFFITTAWVGVLDRAVTWERLRTLCRSGHIIGSHSHTHPILTACSEGALRDELSVSKRILEERLGQCVTSISIPAGRINDRVLAACGEAGYRCVYTSRAGEHKAAIGNSPEVIGRFIVTRWTSEQKLASYLRGDRSTLLRLQLNARAKEMVKALIGDSIYHKVWKKAVRSQSQEM